MKKIRIKLLKSTAGCKQAAIAARPDVPDIVGEHGQQLLVGSAEQRGQGREQQQEQNKLVPPSVDKPAEQRIV